MQKFCKYIYLEIAILIKKYFLIKFYSITNFENIYNNTMRKIFCFDLDGTLLNPSKNLTSEMHDALIDIKKAGATIIINTGRSFEGTSPFRTGTHNIFDYVIASNGSMIYETAKDKYNYYGEFTFDFAKKIIELVKPFQPMMLVHTQDTTKYCPLFDLKGEHPTWFANDKAFTDTALLASNIYTLDHIESKFVDKKILQITMRATKEIADAMYGVVSTALEGEVDVSISSHRWLDITFKNINKMVGIQNFCKIHGCDPFNDVIAFGDSGNDVAMLAGCAESYAMENATYDAKAAAKGEIGSNASDALAKKVRELMGLVHERKD